MFLHGSLRRFVLKRLVSGSETRRIKSGFCLSQLKRGCLPVPDTFKCKQLLKHAATLSQPAPPRTKEVLQEFRSDCARILDGFHPLYGDVLRLGLGHNPSTSAAWGLPRSTGGAYNWVYKALFPHELIYEEQCLVDMVETRAGVVRPYYMAHYPEEANSFDITEEAFGDEFHSEIRTAAYSWQVVPVLEPLKVRVITKGPPIAQWMLRGLQKTLHSYLKSMKAFELIGKPCNPDIIRRMVHSHHSQNLIWISGDYTSATDMLNANLSGVIIHQILAQIDFGDYIRSKFRSGQYIDREVFLNLALKLIVGGTLWYSATDFGGVTVDTFLGFYDELLGVGNMHVYLAMDRDSISANSLETGCICHGPHKSGDCPAGRRLVSDPCMSECYDENGYILQADMLNGQLMGSILSFPILCLINYITLLQWARRHATSLLEGYMNGGCLINGDDILFPVESLDQYHSWLSYLKVAGFVPSIGKNLYSKRFVQINTEIYDLQSFTQLRYYPVGFLMGQSKLTGREEVRALPVQNTLSEVLDGANTRLHSFRRFLFYNREVVERVTKKGLANLFIPIPLGGLGVYPHSIHVDYSHLQRRIAKILFMGLHGTMSVEDYELSLMRPVVTGVGRILGSARPQKYRAARAQMVCVPDSSARGLSFTWTDLSSDSLGIFSGPYLTGEDTQILSGLPLFFRVMKEKRFGTMIPTEFFDIFVEARRFGEFFTILLSDPQGLNGVYNLIHQNGVPAEEPELNSSVLRVSPFFLDDARNVERLHGGAL
jgi:hypothetical protein